MFGTDAVPQPDGKIIVVGVIGDDYYRNIVIARFNTDCTLDKSFSDGGMETDNFGVRPVQVKTTAADVSSL